MKLPLLQKIEIEHYQEEELFQVFKKNSLGKIPTILLMSNLTIDQVKEVIANCQNLCQSLKIDPHFPYPIYFLNEWNIDQNFFPNINDVKEAPKHFIKKIKRVKKREQGLLDKVTTLSERIQNHSVKEDLQYLKEQAKSRKRLKELCSEKSFYLELLQNLKNPQVDPEKKEV